MRRRLQILKPGRTGCGKIKSLPLTRAKRFGRWSNRLGSGWAALGAGPENDVAGAAGADHRRHVGSDWLGTWLVRSPGLVWYFWSYGRGPGCHGYHRLLLDGNGFGSHALE